MGILFFFAKRFIAGETFEQALPVIKQLNAQGLRVSLDILGESITQKEEAVAVTEQYILVLGALVHYNLKANISLKLTQLGLGIDDHFCLENVKCIVQKAENVKHFVWIDMEGSDYTERIIEVYKALLLDHAHVGLCLQSYLRRTKADIDRLSVLGAKIRLVKGAYKEPEVIAFRHKQEVDANYVKLMKKLLDAGNFVAIATHDEKIIEEAKEYIKQKNIPSTAYEYHMLYGIQRELQLILVHQGYTVRVYTPYGTHWLSYTLRRLRERKENLFFVMKHLFK